MKLKDIHGDWIGLARLDQYPYQIDDHSSPDQWKIGFEIVYRLLFEGDERKLNDNTVISDFQRAFKHSFNIPENHFQVGSLAGGTDYWFIYWNKEGLDLRLLGQCEKEIDNVALKHEMKVTVIEMTIIPRSLTYISGKVKDS